MKESKNIKKAIEIPESFLKDLKICLDLHPPEFSFKYDLDHFLYIASKIIHIKTFKKFSNLKKVPISSVVLRFEIGKHYRRYLEYLLKYKFIETDNHYIVKSEDREGKCKCYCFSRRYASKGYEKYEITKKSLLNKIESWKHRQFGKMISDDMLSHLYSMMNKITIDMDAVKIYLSEAVKSKAITQRKANIELSKCEKINDKETNLFLTKDSYGRVHTNFTNISKHIRENFLSLHGEKLVHLDIISSQPAMLYNLFKDYLMEVLDIVEKRQEDEYYTSPKEYKWKGVDVRDKYVNKSNSYTGKHIYSNKFMPVVEKHGEDSYMDLLEKGFEELTFYKKSLQADIYEIFRDSWKHYFGEDRTRKEMKQEWVSYVFGQNNSPGHDKFKYLWDEEFPILNKILKNFKNGNHKPLSHELQRKESDLVFNKLCPKIDNMNIDYFTVHDCVVVPESVADDVYNVFSKILKENNVVTGVDY